MKEKNFDSLKERAMFYFADDSLHNWNEKMSDIANTVYLRDYKNVTNLERANNLGGLAKIILGPFNDADGELITMSSREIENLLEELGKLNETQEKVIRLTYGVNESNTCYSYQYASEKVLLYYGKEHVVRAIESRAIGNLKALYREDCDLEKLELSKYARVALKLAGIKSMTHFLEITVDTMGNSYHNGKRCFGPKATADITAKRKELGVPLS